MNESTVEEGEFENLKAECLRNEKLFEDLTFTPSDKSLYTENSKLQLEWKEAGYEIKWIRASKMVEDPKFFLGGAARFDVNQGSGVGDCWFVAAMANLTLHEKLFAKVVPPDQSFENDYAGIFHFRFWKDGKWVNVVIDDYLPTINNGKTLLFIASEDKNEFWSALLEKAYAKLHGSYESLDAGYNKQGGVELSGGLSEVFHKNDEYFGDFTILKKACERSSMMGTSINVADGEKLEEEKDNGLVKGHSYSITKVYQAQTDLGEVALIRLRNPWGQHEWKGAWSDSSEEWQYLPDDVKTDKIDGEFFIALDDFIREFDDIEFCHLTPDNCDDSVEYTWD